MGAIRDHYAADYPEPARFVVAPADRRLGASALIALGLLAGIALITIALATRAHARELRRVNTVSSFERDLLLREPVTVTPPAPLPVEILPFTDPDTGCGYIVVRSAFGVAITPRLTRDGLPVCAPESVP